MNNGISLKMSNLPIAASPLEQFAGSASISGNSNTKTLAPPGTESAINSTASEFESIFLSLMLKEMRSTLDQGEGGLFGGEGSDTFGGMFDMFMGQHMAESKPLGIGAAIESYMQNSVSN